MKRSLHAWLFCTAALPLVVSMPQRAAAQEQVPAKDVEAQNAKSGDIVVTASRRASRLQDTPLAVTALTGKSLAEANAVNFADFARSVPGLQFTDFGNGRPKPSIRGINVNIGSSAIGYYIDEAPVPTSLGTLRLTTIDPRLFDVDRVEVLRGPQGTLFGSGSMGGTIRLIPARPDASKVAANVRVSGEIGEGGSAGQAADAMLNLPIVSDRLSVRAVGWERSASGFIDRQVNGRTVAKTPRQQTFGGRIALEYKTTDVRINASVMHEDQEYDGYQNVTFGAANPSGALVQNFLFDTDERNNNRYTLYNLTGQFGLGRAELTTSSTYYRGGYTALEEEGAFLARFVGPAFDDPITERSLTRSFSQEVRLASRQPFGKFDWIVGGFYSDLRSNRGDDWPGPQYGAILGDTNLYSAAFTTREKQAAVFGEVTLHPAPTVSLTAGGRYFDIRRRDRNLADGVFNGGPSDDSFSSESKGAVGKVNVSWKPQRDTLVYAQATQGFRPGFGVARLPTLCAADAAARGIGLDGTQVDPDTVWNYEAGLKGAALDRRLRFSAAGYRIDWTGIQLGVFLPCGFRRIANSGDARINGAELEGSLTIGDHVEVGGTASYTDATFTRTAAGADAKPGDRVLEVPKWQGSSYLRYAFAFGDSTTGFLRADVQYTGKSLLFYPTTVATAPAPLAFRDKPSLLLVNARAQFDFGGWTAALYGRNLLNRVRIVGFADLISANLADRPRFTVNQPRVIGVEIGHRF